MARAAVTYRGARRNAARGSVWTSACYYAKHLFEYRTRTGKRPVYHTVEHGPVFPNARRLTKSIFPWRK
jgi:hypothetical protein